MARTLVAILVVLLLAAGALFFVQNSARMVMLSFDLGVAAWQLQDPVQVPVLMAVCFGAGLLAGGSLAVVRIIRLSSRVRTLEQQVSVTSTFSGTKEPGSW